jgi:hypothetical protein
MLLLPPRPAGVAASCIAASMMRHLIVSGTGIIVAALLLAVGGLELYPLVSVVLGVLRRGR